MRRLLHSSKALLVLLVIAIAFVSLLLGKASWSDVEGLIKWVVGPFVLAVGVEDAAKNWGAGRGAS